MLNIKDQPGCLPVETMRSYFEGLVHNTPVFSAKTPLDVVTINDRFCHYADPETDRMWVGFALGMRCAERVEKAKAVQAVQSSVFVVRGTRYGYKEDTTWTLASWNTKEAAEAHVAFLEAKLQEAADQVAEGCTTGLDYPDREKIEELMVEYDRLLELGTNGAGWSIEEVPSRTDTETFTPTKAVAE